MSQYCRACPAEILWAIMPSGKRNPLDRETVPLEDVAVGKGIIAYNAKRRTGVSITGANVDQVPRWAALGVTFHISHWATCEARKAIRREVDENDLRECPIKGCSTEHPRSLLMCREHWRQVPKPLRDTLWRAYHDEGVGSEEYDAARSACIAAVEGP